MKTLLFFQVVGMKENIVQWDIYVQILNGRVSKYCKGSQLIVLTDHS